MQIRFQRQEKSGEMQIRFQRQEKSGEMQEEEHKDDDPRAVALREVHIDF